MVVTDIEDDSTLDRGSVMDVGNTAGAALMIRTRPDSERIASRRFIVNPHVIGDDRAEVLEWAGVSTG